MTSKLVVNTIEADTGISSVSFASSISMSSTSKFHFGNAGIDIGADTNINRPSAGVLGFNINSSEKVRITSAGLVGIGITDPGTHLHVNSGAYNGVASFESTDQYAHILIKDNSTHDNGTYFGVEGNNFRFLTHDGTSSLERLRIGSDGKLTTNTTGTISAEFNTSNSQGSYLQFDMGNSGTTIGYLGSAVQLVSGAGVDDLGFRSAAQTVFSTGGATERLRIHSDGKLTTNTTGVVLIDLNTSSSQGGYLQFDSGASGANIGYMGAGSQLVSGANVNDLGIRSTANFIISTGGATERLRISSGGLLTATGNADFNVAGGEFDIYSTGSGDQHSLRLLNSDASAGNKIGIYFGPANNVAGAYISGVAESDFTSAANRDAGLEFGTRLNATFQTPLKISAAGYVTKPNQPSFLVAPANDGQTANGYGVYTTVFHNTGNHYSTSNGRFTAPVTGYYNFGANYVGAAACENVFVRFYINGGYSQRGQHYSGGGNAWGTGSPYMSCDLSATHTLLQAGDYVNLHLAAAGASQGQSAYMRFYGYLVH